MPALGAVEVDDGLPGDIAIRDLDADIIVRSQPRRAPVDFNDLGIPVIDKQPVSMEVGFAHLQGYPRDNIADQVLRRQTQDDRRNSRRDQ